MSKRRFGFSTHQSDTQRIRENTLDFIGKVAKNITILDVSKVPLESKQYLTIKLEILEERAFSEESENSAQLSKNTWESVCEIHDQILALLIL